MRHSPSKAHYLLKRFNAYCVELTYHIIAHTMNKIQIRLVYFLRKIVRKC